MTRWLIALALLVACKQTQSDDFPIQPGGIGGGGGGGHADAAIPDGADANGLAGRVCVLTDPRDFTSCSTAAAGLTVMLGAELATTTGNGSFVITPPTTEAPFWQVTGTGLMTAVFPATGPTTIPALTTATYSSMAAASDVTIQDGTGAIVMHVEQGGGALSKATVAVDPAGDNVPLYDVSSALAWGGSATGAAGGAWIPNQPAATAELSVSPMGAVAQNQSPVPVFAGAITFDTVMLTQ